LAYWKLSAKSSQYVHFLSTILKMKME